jgi:hypothetical protein
MILEEEKREWIETCKLAKKTENPLDRLCYDILGVIPDYELTFEEWKNDDDAFQDKRHRIADQEVKDRDLESKKTFQSRRRRPEGITNKEWEKERKRVKREKNEKSKQDQLDRELEYKYNPANMLYEKIEKIKGHCDCKGENIRQGIVCPICKILTKVDSYMMTQLKDAAGGRSTIV